MLRIEVNGEKDEVDIKVEHTNLYEMIGAVQALKEIIKRADGTEGILFKEILKRELDWGDLRWFTYLMFWQFS